MTRLLRKVVEGIGEPEADGVHSGIDVIGDLAIVKFSRGPVQVRELVGEKILREMSNVKGVFEQEGGIEGEYRLRKLRHLAGERRTTINADATALPDWLEGKFDRILMPHPSRADRYLGAALLLVADGGVIHYYRHISAEDFDQAKSAILHELREVQGLRSIVVRKVREVGPRWLEVVADLQLSRN